jgi:hypothetical protein
VFYNKTLLLLFMKFCIKSDETTFERRREKKGKMSAKTHSRPYTMVLCPYKIFGKIVPTNPLNPTLIKNTKKTKTPNNNARKKKMVRPPVVESRF